MSGWLLSISLAVPVEPLMSGSQAVLPSSIYISIFLSFHPFMHSSVHPAASLRCHLCPGCSYRTSLASNLPPRLCPKERESTQSLPPSKPALIYTPPVQPPSIKPYTYRSLTLKLQDPRIHSRVQRRANTRYNPPFKRAGRISNGPKTGCLFFRVGRSPAFLFPRGGVED